MLNSARRGTGNYCAFLFSPSLFFWHKKSKETFQRCPYSLHLFCLSVFSFKSVWASTKPDLIDVLPGNVAAKQSSNNLFLIKLLWSKCFCFKFLLQVVHFVWDCFSCNFLLANAFSSSLVPLKINKWLIPLKINKQKQMVEGRIYFPTGNFATT